ncbi:hypothetical protein ACL02S_10470 [Nocardia sp. 004]
MPTGWLSSPGVSTLGLATIWQSANAKAHLRDSYIRAMSYAGAYAMNP